jgi:hypothetical protein
VTHNAPVIPVRLAPLAALCLVASGLAVALTSSPASAEVFKERWCTDKPAPCLLSATRNGVALTAADPDISVEMIGAQNTADFKYTAFLVRSTSGVLDLTDTYSLTFDLGDKVVPDYTESYTSRPDVDRIDDGDGTHKLTITGKPVLLTYGCNDSYPSVCPTTATDQTYEFSGEIQQLKTNFELRGFDRSQSVDSVNGIFLETPPGAAPYLTSDWANSHFQTDGTTVVRGQARFRIPYSLLESSFGVPDPETMVSSSIVGSVNGNPADFDFTQDPDGGGVYVDIAGVTFSNKTIKVKRGKITPTRTKLISAKRKAPQKAKLVFERSTPRGAKVTGYQARCVSGRSVETAKAKRRAFRTGMVVLGLTPGRTYSCAVRALSKAGPGKYSKAKKV